MILASQETKSRACWVEGASYTNPALQRSRAERVPRLLLAVSFTIQNIMYVPNASFTNSVEGLGARCTLQEVGGKHKPGSLPAGPLRFLCPAVHNGIKCRAPGGCVIDFFGRREQKRFASPCIEEDIFFFSAEAGREGGEGKQRLVFPEGRVPPHSEDNFFCARCPLGILMQALLLHSTLTFQDLAGFFPSYSH